MGVRIPMSIYRKLDSIREKRGIKTMAPVIIEACKEYVDIHYTPDEGLLSVAQAKEEIAKMIRTDTEFRKELLQDLIYELEHLPEKEE